VAGTAKKMRLSDYILERILTRSVPEAVSSRSPSVLMKVDIEGSELEVLTDMIVSGALQVEDFTYEKTMITMPDIWDYLE
jgi:hypothetical protein